VFNPMGRSLPAAVGSVAVSGFCFQRPEVGFCDGTGDVGGLILRDPDIIRYLLICGNGISMPCGRGNTLQIVQVLVECAGWQAVNCRQWMRYDACLV
jgi:hypothetical protein